MRGGGGGRESRRGVAVVVLLVRLDELQLALRQGQLPRFSAYFHLKLARCLEKHQENGSGSE